MITSEVLLRASPAQANMEFFESSSLSRSGSQFHSWIVLE